MASAQFAIETTAGAFARQPNRFTARITRDSDSAPGEGPDALGRWPVEPGRYRLVWSRACPWAHRARIVLGLLGLDDAISLATVDPIRDEAGWRFTLDPDGRDPVLGIAFLSEAYLATDPSFAGRVTVPAIVDTLSGRVVTNDYPQITLDLSSEWVDHHGADAPDLYPVELRPEIDAVGRVAKSPWVVGRVVPVGRGGARSGSVRQSCGSGGSRFARSRALSPARGEGWGLVRSPREVGPAGLSGSELVAEDFEQVVDGGGESEFAVHGFEAPAGETP